MVKSAEGTGSEVEQGQEERDNRAHEPLMMYIRSSSSESTPSEVDDAGRMEGGGRRMQEMK